MDPTKAVASSPPIPWYSDWMARLATTAAPVPATSPANAIRID